MKTVAETLGIARSNLAEQAGKHFISSPATGMARTRAGDNSDHLELTCRNGDIARILFVIDACDREIIARLAVAHAGVSGEMVRDRHRLYGQGDGDQPPLGLRLAFTPVARPKATALGGFGQNT